MLAGVDLLLPSLHFAVPGERQSRHDTVDDRRELRPSAKVFLSSSHPLEELPTNIFDKPVDVVVSACVAFDGRHSVIAVRFDFCGDSKLGHLLRWFIALYNVNILAH